MSYGAIMEQLPEQGLSFGNVYPQNTIIYAYQDCFDTLQEETKGKFYSLPDAVIANPTNYKCYVRGNIQLLNDARTANGSFYFLLETINANTQNTQLKTALVPITLGLTCSFNVNLIVDTRSSFNQLTIKTTNNQTDSSYSNAIIVANIYFIPIS